MTLVQGAGQADLGKPVREGAEDLLRAARGDHGGAQRQHLGQGQPLCGRDLDRLPAELSHLHPRAGLDDDVDREVAQHPERDEEGIGSGQPGAEGEQHGALVGEALHPQRQPLPRRDRGNLGPNPAYVGERQWSGRLQAGRERIDEGSGKDLGVPVRQHQRRGELRADLRQLDDLARGVRAGAVHDGRDAEQCADLHAGRIGEVVDDQVR